MGKITAEMRQQAAAQYGAWITQALEGLRVNAFQGSQVESPENGKWQLFHRRDDGEKVIDLTVRLEDNGRRIIGFDVARSTQGRGHTFTTIELTRESLDEAIRRCLYSN
jgi:hypothetical protein